VNALVETEHENEQLNDSIINLLQAVSQLSQRDLTIKVPVTEDVTGPVADALNLLTDETASVLQGVIRISEEVAVASDKVKAQSDTVIAVADHERQAVEQTATDLASAADAMKQIADLAQTCNATAETTIKTTQAALQTVTNTVGGINSTRDTIRETEKRIKRLGERSQEISGVVNLINTIAERTHILALNASMHAASAGEAGRGFAVVADEVQRLAENAREATSQIAALVSNIQIETADTVNAMNAAISQVVDSSRLAEQAGAQMKLTQETTAELGTAVQQIVSRSQEQAHVSGELLDRAQQIQESTHQTRQQLQEQTVQTTNLVEYAKGLLKAVRVFRLPA
jgi:methyl-accepting chemotaxis protein